MTVPAQPEENTMSDPLMAEVLITIAFHDVDMMGFVWHGHYARYFEIAREAVLRRVGYGYPAMNASGYAWPVVDMQTRYRKPLRHEQQIRVTARITESENYLGMAYEIRDAHSGACLARATTRQMAVDMQSGETCLASPAVLRDKIKALS